jgi:hypothetical protein
MNLGAEQKKVAMLAGLVVVGAYVFYTNVLSSSDPVARTTATDIPAAGAAVAANPAGPRPGQRKTKTRGRSSEAWVPTVPFRPEDKPNPTTYDPTLKLEMLAKVQALEPEGGARSLFQFSVAPPVEMAMTTQVPPIHPKQLVYGPQKPPPPPGSTPKPPEPPPPPITLKFYGYSTPRADGQKRAFFLDGDDIFVAAEGEMVKKRYRVVQIQVNSVVMEDTQYKNNRQTLIIQAEQVG